MTAISTAPRARVIAGSRLTMPVFVANDPDAAAAPNGSDLDAMSLTDRLRLTGRIRRFVTHRRTVAVS